MSEEQLDKFTAFLYEKQLEFTVVDEDVEELKPEIWASIYGYSESATCPGCDEKMSASNFHAALIDRKEGASACNMLPLCLKCDKGRGETHAYTFLLGKKPELVKTLFSKHASYYNYEVSKYET